MLHFEKVREAIKLLDESDAKSLLFLIFARLDTAINGTGGEEGVKQTVQDLYAMFSEMTKRNQ